MAKLALSSSAFEAGGKIPTKYTGEGADVSPPLRWTGAPAATREFALVCDDPDAPRKEPWVHWVAYRISPERAGLEEGATTGFVAGLNDFGRPGYGGPMPPEGHGVHHYRFKLYALDVVLDADPGLRKAELLAKIRGHVIAEGELVGVYERP